MCGTAKLKTRLMTSRKPICAAIASMPRPRAITKVAPKRPKTAPEAPTVSAFGSSSRAPKRAGEQRGEVEDDEARRADRRLQQAAEEVEQRTC